MFGTQGIDHLAQPGFLSAIVGGSCPSRPSSEEPPLIWQILEFDSRVTMRTEGIVCRTHQEETS